MALILHITVYSGIHSHKDMLKKPKNILHWRHIHATHYQSFASVRRSRNAKGIHINYREIFPEYFRHTLAIYYCYRMARFYIDKISIGTNMYAYSRKAKFPKKMLDKYQSVSPIP